MGEVIDVDKDRKRRIRKNGVKRKILQSRKQLLGEEV